MQTRNTNLIGISSAITASVFFSINDTVIKFLSGDYALHQVVLIRSALALCLTCLVLIPLSGGFGQLRTRRPGVHALRGFLVVMANMLFFMGLAALPIAEATAIFFISPLIITGFSVIFLGETVGPRRWAAVLLGLIGVLVIIRPGGDSFQPAALLPLGSAFGYAGLHMLTRKLGSTDSPVSMAFYIQVIFILVSGTFGLTLGNGGYSNGSSASLEFLTRAWGSLDPGDTVYFVILGLASGLGGWMISRAYALCEAGLAAPFEYTAMVLAVAFGWVVFGEWPDNWTWAGIGLILGSGLFVALRETRTRPARR
ncbi:DMT family transporter [Aliiroseovarius sp.]|uniref:DMT family transporter n=1 Tax=Aliiroseovarius sp. TaxID=1872442 RepID=UPI0026116887|nr:DMT family transporter [Aliiroseovarius sp.]